MSIAFKIGFNYMIAGLAVYKSAIKRGECGEFENHCKQRYNEGIDFLNEKLFMFKHTLRKYEPTR